MPILIFSPVQMIMTHPIFYESTLIDKVLTMSLLYIVFLNFRNWIANTFSKAENELRKRKMRTADGGRITKLATSHSGPAFMLSFELASGTYVDIDLVAAFSFEPHIFQKFPGK